MNNYQLSFRGDQGSITVYNNNNKYILNYEYNFININGPSDIWYTTNGVNKHDSLVIQTNSDYYSIIFDQSILTQNNEYLYYFLHIDNILDKHRTFQYKIYGCNIIEPVDIHNVTIYTTYPTIFDTFVKVSTFSKKPLKQTSSYCSTKSRNFLTMLKNEYGIYASCSYYNGSKYISFCGMYEATMEQFLIYNLSDIFIHKQNQLEYADLEHPINLDINFTKSV